MRSPGDGLDDNAADALREALGGRSIVFVGLMGAGKTSIGRKLAQKLALPFADSDHEIEDASRMSVPELFERYGEPEFRQLETRVIARLLEGGPQVLSTGGGAFMSEATRLTVRHSAVSVWLKAELDVLVERVKRKDNRPLLRTGDPQAILARLMEERHPTYGLADVTVPTREERKEVIADEVAVAVLRFLDASAPASPLRAVLAEPAQ